MQLFLKISDFFLKCPCLLDVISTYVCISLYVQMHRAMYSSCYVCEKVCSLVRIDRTKR